MSSPLDAAVTAALTEYAKWGTGSDSRRPADHRSWVGREAFPGEWTETSSHPNNAAAEAALKPQAMRSAVLAAVAAWIEADKKPTSLCPFNDEGAPDLPDSFGAGDPCPVCGDLGTFSHENMDRPSRCVSPASDPRPCPLSLAGEA